MLNNIFYGRTPLVMGIAFGAGFWIFEGLVHYFIFSKGNLLQEMLPFTHPHELWMRVFTSLLFVLFGDVIRYVTKDQLISQKEFDQLRKAVPICSLCGKVLDKNGKWLAIKEYGDGGSANNKSPFCQECRSIHNM